MAPSGLRGRRCGTGRIWLGGAGEARACSLELFDEGVEVAELVCGGVFGDGPETPDHGAVFLALGNGQVFLVEGVGPKAIDVGLMGFDFHLGNVALWTPARDQRGRSGSGTFSPAAHVGRQMTEIRLPRRSLAVVAIALPIPLAGCFGFGHSEPTSTRGCGGFADRSRPTGRNPAMIALLDGNRLVRISLPGGAIEAERRLEARAPGRPVDERDSFRLEAPTGPSLATAPDGKTVVALIRRPASEGDRVAVIDARNLRVRCSHPLVKGVRHTGLLLGRSGKFYAYGNRSTGLPGRWDAVLTIGDARTGRRARTQTLRKAAARGEPARGAKDWYVYWAALSADERRLVLSYHGGDTTGGDWFRISRRLRVSAGDVGERRCLRRFDGACPPGWTDIGWLHGAVAPVGTGFLGTAGSNFLLELDRRGRETGRVRVRASHNHLMDFALAAHRRLAYVSGCGRRPIIERLDLARNRQEILRSGPFCGRPLAVHGDRSLLIDAIPVSNLGYPRTTPPQLRLFDLERPGAGRPIPRSSGALDAVVVRPRG